MACDVLPLCCTHAGQHLSEQLATKEPTVLTASAGIATAHYTSIRWSGGSSVSFPAAGAGSVGGDKTESAQTSEPFVTTTQMAADKVVPIGV